MFSCTEDDHLNMEAEETEILIDSPYCFPNASIEGDFEEDVIRMATLLTDNNAVSAPDDCSLSQALFEQLMNALLVVHHSSGIARDQVIDEYQIKSFKDPYIGQLQLVLDESFDWVSAFMANNKTTGNSSIDGLIENFNFSIASIDASTNTAIVSFEGLVNINALTNLLIKVDGINGIQQLRDEGKGNDISARILNNGDVELSYHLREDCVDTDCGFEHIWQFTIQDCKLIYVAEFGDDLP